MEILPWQQWIHIPKVVLCPRRNLQFVGHHATGIRPSYKTTSLRFFSTVVLVIHRIAVFTVTRTKKYPENPKNGNRWFARPIETTYISR